MEEYAPQRELAHLLRDTIKQKRSYAGFWSWSDREVAKLGVARELLDALANESGTPPWRFCPVEKATIRLTAGPWTSMETGLGLR